MLALLVWTVIGVVLGLVARALYPGRDAMRVHITLGLALMGAIGGGLVANDLFADRFLRLGITAWVGGLVGALAVLALGSGVRRMRARAASRPQSG